MLPGSEIAGARLTREIARGGMAIVYLAERLDSGEPVVVKVLKGELEDNEQIRRRFVREARYASSLDHPHVVRIHAAGEAEGAHYIVMQYVPGMDLRARLASEGTLEPDEAVRVLSQIADALDAAHAAGLLHRDVKPGNVLIASGEGPEPEGDCFLTDFGLSKDPGQDSRALTVSGEFVGTVLYAAPEQMTTRELDARADVYSLGCVLYECLVGTPPFTGNLAAEVMQAHFESAVPRPSKQRSGLPVRLDRVIARALAKEPGERYATCGELIDAAREALGVPAIPTPQAGRGERLMLLVAAGRAAGAQLELGDVLVIGRSASDEGRLGGDAGLSGEHARISRSPKGYLLEDLGSTSGTFLNGRRVAGPELIRAGDAITVGATTLMVRVGSVEPAAPPPAAPPPAAPVAQVVSLRLTLDFDSPEAGLRLDERSDEVRIVPEGGRWRFAGR
jgi:pSer/pThr/pTyr-binding forkhead associated (FHA) protein/tRNA A-37 threonylcarbamoyl transferase component Bud32